MPSIAAPEAQALPRAKVETIHEENVEGRRHVAHLARMAADSERLLVQFFDTRDVWAIDVASQSKVRVASPADRGVMLVPELHGDWKSLSVQSHKSQGAFYVFGSRYSEVCVVLVDADRDGTIDAHMVLDEEEWAAAGYHDPQNFEGN